MTQPKIGTNQLDVGNPDNPLTFEENVAPATPASGTVALYAKADGHFYSKDDAGVETELAPILKGSTTFDFASIASNTSATTTITVTGAAVGDPVALGRPTPTGTGAVTELTFEAFVSATDTVTLNVVNATTGAADLASATYNVVVFKF